jgi:hypothetical protein
VLLLADVEDDFREERREGPGVFLFDVAFKDQGHSHRLRFYVSDAHAVAGVLVVTHVDHEVHPLP